MNRTIRCCAGFAARVPYVERPEPGQELGDGSWTAAEVVFAVRHVCTANIVDFVQRRPRLSLFTPDHSRDSAELIGRIMAAELGWNDARLATELQRLEEELRAEGL